KSTIGSTIGSLIDSWIIPAAFPFYSLPRSLILLCIHGLGSRTKALGTSLEVICFLVFVTDAQDDSHFYILAHCSGPVTLKTEVICLILENGVNESREAATSFSQESK
ncbi:hypothetical protein E2320_010031, partial [Naja naja]